MDQTSEIIIATTDSGRVYRKPPGMSVLIEWVPPAPLHGFSRFTDGLVVDTKEHGLIVQFRERVKVKKTSQTISASLKGDDRAGLRELVQIASDFKDAENREAQRRREADVAAKTAARQAEVDAFVATLDPSVDWVQIDTVDHDPDAADGWGLTTYKHAGEHLSWQDIGGLSGKQFAPPSRLNRCELLVFVDRDRLESLIANRKAAKAAKIAEQQSKTAEQQSKKDAKFAEARDTGKPVELESWTEDCDGSVDECSTDIVTRYAQPDGSTKTKRIHTH